VTPQVPRVPIAVLSLAAPAVPAELRAAAASSADDDVASGGLRLVTCQRVEVYTSERHAEALVAEPPWTVARRRDGISAAHHAIGVALGLESGVIGEDQVLHQLRAAVTDARRRSALSEPLAILFELALRAGRTGRSWRPSRPRSLADVAVARLATLADGSFPGRTVLVVGAGEMGRLTALAAAAAGARVVVISPTAANALDVAAAAGGTATSFDAWPAGVSVDAVVVALSGRWHLTRTSAEALLSVPNVIDLSMPSALPDEIVRRLGPAHLDLDGLIAGTIERDEKANRIERRYLDRLEELRELTVTAYLDRLAERASADVAAALAGRIERDRAAELEALWRRLPQLAEHDRAAIDEMSRHLAKRLFRVPLSRIAEDPSGRRGRVAQELFEL
jgi:glutamyl-tRNA reductase